MPRLRHFALAISLGLTGCEESPLEKTAFDPRGTDSEVYGEWDVNGGFPSTEVCERAGLDEVEIEFSNTDDTETFTSPAFRFPCDATYYDSVGPVLREGPIGYQWHAYSGDELVLQSARYATTVVAGEELVLKAINFPRRINVRVDVTLAWATGLDNGSCAEALVDTMNWELRRGTVGGAVVSGSNADIPCVEAFSIPDLPIGILEEGAYVLVVHGDALDGATWDAECAVTVLESGSSTVGCAVAVTP